MKIVRAALLPALLIAGQAPAQQSAPQPAQQPAAPPPACTSAEHRQFDFWVGRWEVYQTGTDRLAGHSLIETLYNGCAIRENWMPLRAGHGGSLNAWIPSERKWRQTWLNSSNSYAVFEGAFEDGAMVMSGVWPGAAGPGSTPLVRIRWTREADGAVRQFGEASTDQGQTWSPAFDFTYRPVRSGTD